MFSRAIVIFMAVFVFSCASNQGDWSNIDYAKIARENQRRENDATYTPPVPTVIGCVDDDLYNCNPQTR